MVLRRVKYNPAFLSEDELIRSFVVRHADLDLIVQTIRENVSESNQHVLVTGPRGTGKTSLALRVAAEVRRDEELRKKWYPLVFSEESYMVNSPGEFWLEALFHLHQQTGDDSWKQTYDELLGERDEGRLRERALGQLMDFADGQQRRILLMVENFGALIGDQLGKDGAWVLRHTLVNEPRIMMLATAVSRFAGVENPGEALYELFRLQALRPLDEEECAALWTNITGGKPPDSRMRPIQILTGGNARLVAIIASFGAHLSFKDLMDDLMKLVDENTEYFKSHLDGLPSVERKVYLSLAELWAPSTARVVARAARLEVSKVSSLLNRLIARGAVVVDDDGRRTKSYQVAERMYNVYYLMRRRGAASDRVKAVVNFMIGLYGPEGLRTVARRIAVDACSLEPEQRREHYVAFDTILREVPTDALRNSIVNEAPPEFFTFPDLPSSLRDWAPMGEEEPKGELAGLLKHAGALSKQPERLEEAERVYRKAIKIAPDDASIWTKLAGLEIKRRRYEQAGRALERAFELDEASSLAWTLRGHLYHSQPERVGEAEAEYRKAIELDAEAVGAWASLGLLLHERLERYEEAEAAYRKAIELDAEFALAWAQLGTLLHERLERYEEAEAAYRKAVELDAEYAWAWAQLGKLLHERLERYEEAEAAYRKAIELDAEYAWPWLQLGILLHEHLGRYKEAEAAFRKSIELDAAYTWAWVQLGLLLHEHLERFEEVEAAYRKAIELDAENIVPWACLGTLLHERVERYEEAEAAYRKAIELDPRFAAWPRLELICLLLKQADRAADAFGVADEYLKENPRNASFLNSVAWRFYKSGPFDALSRAEEWARQAVTLEPERADYQRTLGSILCATGDGPGALAATRSYVEDPDVVRNTVSDAIEFFVALAAAGHAREALDVLRNSPSAELLEPMEVALALFLGEEVKAAAEVREVAEDVVKKIRAAQADIR